VELEDNIPHYVDISTNSATTIFAAAELMKKETNKQTDSRDHHKIQTTWVVMHQSSHYEHTPLCQPCLFINSLITIIEKKEEEKGKSVSRQHGGDIPYFTTPYLKVLGFIVIIPFHTFG
jgi:hypothetical protein